VRINLVTAFVFNIDRLLPFGIDRQFSKIYISTIFGFGRQLMSLYVGNLYYEVGQEDLSSVFAEYGSVKRVQLPTDRETGRPRGFGFVEMGTEAEEDAAIEALDGAEWMGRALKVNKAKPREDRGGNSRGGYSKRY